MSSSRRWHERRSARWLRLPLETSIDTLEDVIPRWERSLRAKNRSPKTIRSYVDTARLLQVFLAGQHRGAEPAGSIAQEHLELFIDDQLRRWRPATAAVRFRSLQQLFAWLVEEAAIDESPMSRMRSPRVPEHPVPIVPDEDLRALLATCRDDSFENVRDMALLRLMIETVARLAEATGITLQNVDLDEGCVTVLGKGRRRRTVPIGLATQEAILRYLDVRAHHDHAERRELWLWPAKEP